MTPERALRFVSHAAHEAALARSDRDTTIRAAHEAGATLRAIAEAAGMSFQRVHQIVKAAAKCRHGVEAGNYCAKCGREIVSGPVITGDAARHRAAIPQVYLTTGPPASKVVLSTTGRSQ